MPPVCINSSESPAHPVSKKPYMFAITSLYRVIVTACCCMHTSLKRLYEMQCRLYSRNKSTFTLGHGALTLNPWPAWTPPETAGSQWPPRTHGLWVSACGWCSLHLPAMKTQSASLKSRVLFPLLTTTWGMLRTFCACHQIAIPSCLWVIHPHRPIHSAT